MSDNSTLRPGVPDPVPEWCDPRHTRFGRLVTTLRIMPLDGPESHANGFSPFPQALTLGPLRLSAQLSSIRSGV